MEIRAAIAEAQRIFKTTMFPEMKVDWRVHPNYIGHLLFPGCFRCHDGNHVSPDSKALTGFLVFLPCPVAQVYFGTFSQSSRNFLIPASVSGCLASCMITENGMVAISAPIRAAFSTWTGLRMLATMISAS